MSVSIKAEISARLDVRAMCMGMQEECLTRYSRAYRFGAERYEGRMKASEKEARKWGRRAVRALDNERFVRAFIEWL